MKRSQKKQQFRNGKQQPGNGRQQLKAKPAIDYDIYHIGVLDGIRAVAILIVVWYHFWQQSWLTPIAGPVNLDWLVRNGSILVDMMILLSGFCLFLPYAREMVLGEKAVRCSEFYVKRVARIAPSYYLSLVIVLLFFAIPLGEYGGDLSFMWADIFGHLTFTHNLFGNLASSTKLNGVLWTVAVEVQFYIIFPLLAKWFRKQPILTYIGMVAIGFVSSYMISSQFDTIDQTLYVNHTLTFFSVFANGMLGAWLYVLFAVKRKKKTIVEGILGIIVAIGGIVLFRHFCDWRLASGNETKWQVDNRYLLSLVYLLIVAGSVFAVKWFQKIWDNRVMAFLAGISFNVYICHQYIAVKLKEFRIPDWEGEELPNMTGDVEWQWKYMILCIVLSLVVATLMTYLVERPAARWIKKLYNEKSKKKNK